MAGNWFETALAFLFLIVIFFSFWGVTHVTPGMRMDEVVKNQLRLCVIGS